ncbi:MAG: hypothetical protein AABY33_07660 [Pseudomonadota bacterium]
MSDPKLKSNITPEEIFANLEKVYSQFEAATKSIKKEPGDDNSPYEFDGRLNKEQAELYARVLAATATHETVKLDGIGGRPNNVIENGEYRDNKVDRNRILANETWYEIVKRSDKKTGMFFDDGLPDISGVSHQTLNSIISEKEAIIKDLSAKPKNEVVEVMVGNTGLNLTAEAAITFHKDVANFVKVLNKAKQDKGDKDTISPDITPSVTPIIQQLEKPRLI